jgi:fructose-1,6-bisphosphatase/inositol monophosphatase family enzyme
LDFGDATRTTVDPPYKVDMSDFMQAQRLSNLCHITTRACTALSPMVLAFYSAITGETAKLKSDASVFTIADGIVQHLLVDHLFKGGKFAAIVGEEEGSVINIHTAPYKVDDLTVPQDFYGIIETARSDLAQLSNEIDQNLYNDLTVFIDPIDGTREFSTGLGEQCSICIGFADKVGKPVAGVVYRPITQPPTYAAGAVSEGFTDSNLHNPAELQNPKGLLTSNGGTLHCSAQNEVGRHGLCLVFLSKIVILYLRLFLMLYRYLAVHRGADQAAELRPRSLGRGGEQDADAAGGKGCRLHPGSRCQPMG